MAYRLAGRADEAWQHYQLALAATVKFTDASDRATFDRLYPAP